MTRDCAPNSANEPSPEALLLELITLRTLVDGQANRIVEQSALIEEQAKLIESMRSEMTELLARLTMNSRNSSKPPSSDGYFKPALNGDQQHEFELQCSISKWKVIG